MACNCDILEQVHLIVQNIQVCVSMTNFIIIVVNVVFCLVGEGAICFFKIIIIFSFLSVHFKNCIIMSYLCLTFVKIL